MLGRTLPGDRCILPAPSSTRLLSARPASCQGSSSGWQQWSSAPRLPVGHSSSRIAPSGVAVAAAPGSAGALGGMSLTAEFSDAASTSTASSQGSRTLANRQAPYVFITGAFVLPHPDKAAKGGEDWFYVSDSMRSIGVADGVGGWADVGVDAGIYARQLMGFAKEIADQSTADGSPEYQELCNTLASCEPDKATQANLQQVILERAYNKTAVRGSSTACLLVLAGNRMFASNLGDSGFLILRNGQIIFHTPQQQHKFNFPYQIGSPDSMSDQPQSSQRFEILTQVGDIIIMGTDGLWDNCFDEEIMSVIRYCQDVNMPMDKTAEVLAHYAHHRASDPKFASPFAYAAFQAGFAYMGGKMDDITVVVARVADINELGDLYPLPGQGGLNFMMPQSSKL